MFDSAPPNLPVEPTATTPPQQPSPQMPSGLAPKMPAPARPSSPPVPLSKSAKKEPEDIFAGIEKTPPPTAPMPVMEEAPPRSNPLKLVLLIVGGLLLLGVIGIAVWMFVLRPKSEVSEISPVSIGTTPSTPVEQPPSTPTPAVETPPPAPAPAPVTTPPEGVSIPTPVTSPIVTAPAAAPEEGKDTDADGLSDVEEPYFSADLAVADTDGDGFSDGSEVKNAYDPSVKGKTLAVATFMTHPTWLGWSFSLPRPWSVLQDTIASGRAAISTGTATRFNLEILANPGKDPLDAWLTAQGISAPTSVKTKSGIEGKQSADGLMTYIPWGDTVLRVAYDLNGDAAYEYRTSYAMFLTSLTAPALK